MYTNPVTDFTTFVLSWLHKNFSLLFTCTIGITLLVAATSKLVYPSEYLDSLDRWVSGLEALFVLTLFWQRKKKWIWLFAITLFASWAGYALFWLQVKMPCGCLGSVIPIPPSITFSIDILFWLICTYASMLLGASRTTLFGALLLSCLASLVGFACAHLVYLDLMNLSQ